MARSTPLVRPRLGEIVALLLVSALFLIHALHFKVFLDDAFISFRYARNFAEGLGFVYNPGERVEGYTDFSWVFLLGVLGKLGIDIPSAGGFLGFVFSLTTIVLLRLHPAPARAGLPVWLAWIPPLFLAASLPFAFQSGSGLATALFTFLLTASVYTRERWRADPVPREALPLALLALTRPEGCLIFLVFLGVELAGSVFSAGTRGRLRRALALALTFGALFVPYFLWRWTYYGFLLPNTFYAKVGATSEQVGRGLRYAGDFFPHVAGPMLLVAILFVVFPRARHGQALRIALIAAYTAYVVAVGGDHMPVFRFFVPILPVLYLTLRDAMLAIFESERGARRAAMVRAAEVRPPVPRVLAAGVLIALALALAHTAHFSFREGLGNVFRETLAEKRAQERELRLVGEHFARVAAPGSTIALGVAGAIGYYSRLPILDFFGLTDLQIAHREVGGMGLGAAGHEKGDGYYILSKKPTYVLNTYARLHETPLDLNDPRVRAQLFWSLSERQIASSPDFWKQYRVRTVALAGRYLIYYERIGAPG